MRIRWTDPAVRDLTCICDYIRDHNAPAAARRVALTLYQSTNTLAQFPSSGRPGRKSGTRELVIHGLPFLAVYRLHKDSVEILRVLHGAQNWP